MKSKRTYAVLIALFLSNAAFAGGTEEFAGTWQSSDDNTYFIISPNGDFALMDPEVGAKPHIFGKLEKLENGEFTYKMDPEMLALMDEKDRKDADNFRVKLEISKDHKLSATYSEKDKDGKLVTKVSIASSVNHGELMKSWAKVKEEVMSQITGKWKLKSKTYVNHKVPVDPKVAPTDESFPQKAEDLECKTEGSYEMDGKKINTITYTPKSIEFCKDGRCIINDGQYETIAHVNCLTKDVGLNLYKTDDKNTEKSMNTFGAFATGFKSERNGDTLLLKDGYTGSESDDKGNIISNSTGSTVYEFTADKSTPAAGTAKP